MWGGVIGLIIQLISGAVGGNIAGAAMNQYSLGTVGNSIAGLIGGGRRRRNGGRYRRGGRSRYRFNYRADCLRRCRGRRSDGDHRIDQTGDGRSESLSSW